MTHQYLKERSEFAREQIFFGNYTRVQRAAKEILKSKNPEFRGEGLLLRGISEFHLGDFDIALEMFDTYIRDYPFSEEAYYHRASIYSEISRFKEAKNDLDILYKHVSNNRDYHELHFYVLLLLDDQEQIVRLADDLLLKYPDYRLAIGERADAWFALKQYDKAIEDLEKVKYLIENPEVPDPQVCLRMGECYLRTEDLVRAERCLNESLQEDMDSMYAKLLLAYLEALQGQHEPAVLQAKNAIYSDPFDCFILYYAAKIFIECDEGNEAYGAVQNLKEVDYSESYQEEIEELMSYLEFE